MHYTVVYGYLCCIPKRYYALTVINISILEYMHSLIKLQAHMQIFQMQHYRLTAAYW